MLNFPRLGLRQQSIEGVLRPGKIMSTRIDDFDLKAIETDYHV
ncbi:hypothetical protein [Chamaesiphon sp. VAR_69_metabat_338]|nr:hypothetical protein [Chamaesiphon sp. VAR_69_metabat_338]